MPSRCWWWVRPGDELPLLNACADAAVTVLEPSELMLEQCRKTVADHPGSSRCRLLLSTLDEALKSELKGARFDLVVCHNVLHLLPSEEQNAMLRELTQCTADGGVLLLSSYSEAEDDESQREVFNVAWQRLRSTGACQTTGLKRSGTAATRWCFPGCQSAGCWAEPSRLACTSAALSGIVHPPLAVPSRQSG